MEHSAVTELALFLNGLWFVISITIFFRHMRRGIYTSPAGIYLLFHFFVFVLRPALIYYFDFYRIYYFIGYFPNQSEYILCMFVASVGLLAFMVGFFFAAHGKSLRLPPVDRGANIRKLYRPTNADWVAFTLVALVVLPVGFYSLSQAGSVHDNMVQARGSGVRIFTEGNGYLALAYFSLGPIFLLLAFLGRFSIFSLMPLVIYIYWRIDYGWGRFSFIVLLLSVFIYVLSYYRLRWRYLPLALGALAVFQMAGRSRGNYDVAWWRVLDNADFANFDALGFILHTIPTKTGTYTYFTQYTQLFTEPIPRALWSDKPVGAPIQLVHLHEFGNFTAMTTSLVGDGWMSAGFIGVILTLGLTGFACSKLYLNYVAKNLDPVFVFAYAAILPLIIFWYRDGGIHAIRLGLFIAGPVILWLVVRRLLGSFAAAQAMGGARR